MTPILSLLVMVETSIFALIAAQIWGTRLRRNAEDRAWDDIERHYLALPVEQPRAALPPPDIAPLEAEMTKATQQQSEPITWHADALPLPTFGGHTIGDGRVYLTEGLHRLMPVACPCCAKNAIVQQRTITHQMIACLDAIVEAGRPLTTQELIAAAKMKGGGEHGRLKHWKLVTVLKGPRYDITDLGRQFLAGDVAVPAVLMIYEDAVIGQSERTQRIHEIRARRGRGEPVRIVEAVEEMVAA
jgi:hypothetical protein